MEERFQVEKPRGSLGDTQEGPKEFPGFCWFFWKVLKLFRIILNFFFFLNYFEFFGIILIFLELFGIVLLNYFLSSWGSEVNFSRFWDGAATLAQTKENP